MNQLERAGRGDDAIHFIGDRACRLYAQHRADALAPCEETVPDGPVNRSGRYLFGRSQPVEFGIHRSLLLVQVLAQIHALSGRNGSGCSLPSFRISISTRVSASSSCLRHVSLRCIPFSKSSSERSRLRSPASSSFTTFSSSSRQLSNG